MPVTLWFNNHCVTRNRGIFGQFVVSIPVQSKMTLIDQKMAFQQPFVTESYARMC